MSPDIKRGEWRLALQEFIQSDTGLLTSHPLFVQGKQPYQAAFEPDKET